MSESREEFVKVLTGVMSSPAIEARFGHMFTDEILAKDFVGLTFLITEKVMEKLNDKFKKKEYSKVIEEQFALN